MTSHKDFIETVRAATNIVEIVSPHTQLKRTGSHWMGRCPFPDHTDRSPSFSVSEDKQLYNCFGCKKSGNVFTFMETFHGMSFREALDTLARRAGLTPPATFSGGEQKRSERESLFSINAVAREFFRQRLRDLPPSHPAKFYAHSRGLMGDIEEVFEIGYAPNEWTELSQYLKSSQLSLARAETLGLVRRKEGRLLPFDMFRHRLMFPIVSTTGDVLGFGGRSIDGAPPKYLNSPESPVFHKGEGLYGLNVTAREIRASDQAILVEGYMDLISLYSAGVRNVAAVLGTALTASHAALLKRLASQILLLLDPDEAGLTGAERALPILAEAGLSCRAVILPDEMDPDEFVRSRGAEGLRAEILRAPDLFLALLDHRWMRNYRSGSPDSRMRVAEMALGGLRGFSASARELYLGELARRLDCTVAWLRRLDADRDQPKRPTQTAAVSNKSSPSTSAQEAKWNSAEPEYPQAVEERLTGMSLQTIPEDEGLALSLLIHSNGLFRELAESCVPGEESVVLSAFENEGARAALNRALVLHRQFPERTGSISASLSLEVDRPEILFSAQELLAGIESRGEGLEGERRALGEIMAAMRRRRLRSQIADLQRELGKRPSQNVLENLVRLQRELRDLGRS